MLLFTRELTIGEVQQIYQGSLTGTSQAKEDVEIAISPNPVSGVLTINWTDKALGLQYVLRDQSGRLILTGQIQSNATTIDITQLPSSVYFLEIGGSTYSKSCTILKK